MGTSQVNAPANERVMTGIKVYYGAEHQLALTSFTSMSIDLSCGGLYLQTDTPLEVGDDIILRFSLPETDKSVTCKGTVAWVNGKGNLSKPEFPGGVGVRFVDLSARDRDAIYRYLTQQPSD